MPLVLSTFLLSTTPAVLGCSADGGGGGGGEGGAGGGGPPACEALNYKVHACIQVDTKQDGPFDLETTGVVTAVRAPQAGDEINGFQYCAGSHQAAPEVLIDLEEMDGSTLTVSVGVPGFSQSSVAQGETLGLRYHWEWVEGTGAIGSEQTLEITRDGALVAAFGHNLPAGPTPQGGPDTCLEELEYDCPLMHQAMEVTRADGTTVSIAEGESADVDGLLITNDEYFRHYNTGCNFATPVEYVMSAVAQ